MSKKKRYRQIKTQSQGDTENAKPKNDVSASKNMETTLIASLILFVIFLSLYRTFSFDVFVDETTYMHDTIVFSKNPFFDSYVQPALYYFIGSFFLKIGGPLAIRATSFLFMALFMIVSYFFFPKRFNKLERMKFILLVISAPIIIEFSKLAYIDIGIFFFAFTGFLFLIRYFENGNNLDLMLSGTALFLAAFQKLTIISFIIAFLLIFLKLKKERNALSSVFSGYSFIFFGISSAGLLLLYLINQQLGVPLSFSHVFGNAVTGNPDGQQMGVESVLKLGLISNIFKSITQIPENALLYYAIFFAAILFIFKIKVNVLNDRKTALGITCITLALFLVGGHFPSRYIFPLLPFIVFIVFEDLVKNRTAYFSAVGVFLFMDIALFGFGWGVPAQIQIIQDPNMNWYNTPVDALLKMTDFVNAKTTENDYVVVSDFGLGPLLTAGKISGKHIVDYEGRKLVVPYVRPPEGTKYIIVNDRDEMDKDYLSFLKANYIFVNQYTQNGPDGATTYFLFEVLPSQTDPKIPKIMPTYPYYSFVDSIFNKNNYNNHKFQ